MPVYQGATFPPAGWIPDVEQLNKVGEAVLAVAYGAIQQHSAVNADGSSGAPASLYERRFVGHGTEAPVERSTRRQLTVVCKQLFPGRASEQQYQFLKGDSGRLGFRTAQFTTEISAPYPVIQGTSAIAVTDIDDVRAKVWRDGFVVFAAYAAWALGGISHPAVGSCHDIMVGALTPRSPAGGEASWTIDTLIQL